MENEVAKVAVLIAARNRKDTTKNCLESLSRQTFKNTTIFLVDDGSTDGTSQMVREYFPEVKLIGGDGKLYWNGGMRLAFDVATRGEFEYYLLLNDDVKLDHDAIQHAVEVIRDTNYNIYAGSVRDVDTGEITYGGEKIISRINRVKLKVHNVDGRLEKCDTFNGNFVLISKEVVDKIGVLSDRYTHLMGDTDYGLRASRAGFKICCGDRFIGDCKFNTNRDSWKYHSKNIKDRIAAINNPKGLPFFEWWHFTKDNAGSIWPIIFISPYLKIFLRRSHR